MKVRITPSEVTGLVMAPPSKSYTHRAVIIATLADGRTRLVNPLMSDDTGYTIDACRRLGAAVDIDGNVLNITGTGGNLMVKPDEDFIYAGNSGSTLRMVAPVAALADARIVLDGDTRLRQRPVTELLEMLAGMGIKARSLNDDGCPPIEVAGGVIPGGAVTVSAEKSSQHISGLLLAAPYAGSDISVKVVGEFRSQPYVAITTTVMRDFGVRVTCPGGAEYIVENGPRYRGREYRIEGDYSQASYFMAAGAIGEGPVTVTGLNPSSVQGDRQLLAILSEMGAFVEYGDDRVTVAGQGELLGIRCDMSDYPDIVQTVAAVAAYASGRTELCNIGHLRVKETDRIGDTALELNKMGIRTEVSADKLVVYGGRPEGAELDSHGDHRMAMSLAVAAGFAEGESVIAGAESVSKSYPGFWTALKSLGVKVEELP